MLVDILQGTQLGPGDGWFRKAVAQTRFGWEATRSRLDKDGDGSISRAEFAGERRRLRPARPRPRRRPDRGRLRLLAPRPDALARGLMLFYRADRDGNGKVTREEFDAFFQALDGGELGLPLAGRPPGRLFTAAGPARRRPPAAPARARRKATLVKGPVPPGDRLAPARPDARRAGPRLHPQDRRRRARRSRSRSWSARSRSS